MYLGFYFPWPPHMVRAMPWGTILCSFRSGHPRAHTAAQSRCTGAKLRRFGPCQIPKICVFLLLMMHCEKIREIRPGYHRAQYEVCTWCCCTVENLENNQGHLTRAKNVLYVNLQFYSLLIPDCVCATVLQIVQPTFVSFLFSQYLCWQVREG